MENKPLVLVIEDDKTIRNFIVTALKSQNYKYLDTDTGERGMALIMSHSPDVVILDLGLPDMDGLKIISQIRMWSDVPIIVVSARGQERDKIEALDLGADDYITKPFGISELLARIRVSIRHLIKMTNKTELPNESFSLADLFIDYEKRTVYLKNNEIKLTPIEYKLLTLLASNAGKVLTHNHIIKNVWGSPVGNENQSLRVFMATLRRKIEVDSSNPRYIITEVGVGYRMLDE